jgi:hypothetical protein
VKIREFECLNLIGVAERRFLLLESKCHFFLDLSILTLDDLTKSRRSSLCNILNYPLHPPKEKSISLSTFFHTLCDL